ncbi:phosphate regulon sensor histidine kinase PhoR [Caenimonas aquaedulcis]|uniref:Phosphate regulon sensor protein PhoR n=1 Tax=Caenimonas aquaedulcis TaxID=2793270 RepID=A0A931H1G3_9BURK|nr:phosphate regulon sensor histidine kinase PhoR [Caenimonas aquaedulcis]MBG9386744.1 phosphate regulon sensor histidine kinase PhoR [Caenimonas aquaedulcis]
MFWRLFAFLACQVAGVALGGFAGAETGAAAGAVAGGLGWFIFDGSRGARMVRWLRAGSPEPAPAMGGLWGEAADRTRRALRARDHQVVEAQERLQDFLAAIQASPNGVVLLDADGRIEWSNQTAAHHLGIDPQRDLLQLIGNLLRDPGFAAYQAGSDLTQEIVIQGRDSSPSRPMRVSVQLHPYGRGRRLLLTRDITGIEQAEAMRRDFVANVSHEIRTPLTVLGGFIETLQTLPLGEEDRARYLALMSQQAQRMQTLVSDLLTLSRLEGSPPPRAAEWTPMATLMVQCEEDARALAAMQAKDLHIEFGPPPALEISGEPHELLSAMSNLVGNAVRYTLDGGSVHVQWRDLPDGRGEISVRDSGVGIAPEHISRLTERFYRVDRSRSRETGGTGLGLAIVKHVVQRHGAELRIDSTPGVGSTFAIVLPAGRLRPASATAGTNARPATESAAGR